MDFGQILSIFGKAMSQGSNSGSPGLSSPQLGMQSVDPLGMMQGVDQEEQKRRTLYDLLSRYDNRLAPSPQQGFTNYLGGGR